MDEELPPLDAFLETSDAPLVVIDADDHVVACNVAARTLTETQDAWRGRHITSFFDSVPQIIPHLRHEPSDAESVEIPDGGNPRNFEVRISPVDSDENPKDGRRVIRLQEVSDVRERELAEAKERYRRILDRFSDYVLILTEDATIDYISPGVEDTLGYEPKGLVGCDAFEFIHPSDEADVRSAFNRMLNEPTEEVRVEYRVQADDDEYRWTEARGTNYLNDSLIGGMLVTIRDVTERKHREEDLKQKNELLDEFARVISHDVSTPLGVIENKARLIEITGDRSHVSDIYDASERARELIDELEALVRKGTQIGTVHTVDLERVTTDAWSTVDDHGAELTVESSRYIDADRSRLRQLLENLLSNAVEHGQSATDIERAITTSTGYKRPVGPNDDAKPNETEAPHEEHADAKAGPSSSVEIRVGAFSQGFYVADDGPGIPDGDRQTVFEEGYTTVTKSTGLGLVIVRRIANAHGWSVTVTESNTGGARFELRTDT